MGRFRDNHHRGRHINDLTSPHGPGMVFPPSYTQHPPDYWARDDDDTPDDDVHAGGLEVLSPYVRGQMIASLERNGDPDGLLAAYRNLHDDSDRRAA